MTTDVARQFEDREELPDNCAFLMNVRNFVDFERIEIAPGHLLRRASDTESHEIRGTIQDLCGLAQRHAISAWEQQWSDDGTHREALPRASWRYFVIAFHGNNEVVNQLNEAFCLSALEIETGPIIMRGQWGGIIHNAGKLFQLIDEASHQREFFVDVSQSAVEEISELRELVSRHDNALIDIRSVVRQLNQLKSLPVGSPLRFLGYFAILESLLTHQPNLTDPYDSITRQVRKKLALVNHRLKAPLDYAPFGEISPQTVWKKLYKYRSLIAHGADAKIEGELAILRSPRAALNIVRQATKAVARQSLYEPQLIVDLRDC